MRQSASLLVVSASFFAVLASCDTGDIGFPAQATRMDVRPQYALWWQMTEACSGRTANLSATTWYSVPTSYFLLGSDTVDGAWWPGDNRIVLAASAIDDGSTVRHEMLHALTRRTDHPAEFFRVRCDGVVGCDVGCASAADDPPDPPANAEVLRARDLIVSLRVDSTVVTDQTGGWAAVTVSVTNPRTHPVWVILDTSAFGPRYTLTFGFGVGSAPQFAGIGRTDYIEINRMSLQAGETKRQTYDFHLDAAPLDTHVWGIFNSDTTASVLISRR